MCFRPAGVKEVVCGRCGIAVYCSVECLITHRDTHRSVMCDVVCGILERKEVSVESLQSMIHHWQGIGNKDKDKGNSDKSTEDPEGSTKGSTSESASEEPKKRAREEPIVVLAPSPGATRGEFFPIMMLPVNVLSIIFAYVTEGHGRNQSASDVKASSYVAIDPTTSAALDLRLVAKKWKRAVEFHDWYKTLILNLDNIHFRYLGSDNPYVKHLLTLRDWLVRFNILDAFLPQSRNIRVLRETLPQEALPSIEDRLQELGSYRGLGYEGAARARSLDCFLIWIAYSQSCENCVNMGRIGAEDYYKILERDASKIVTNVMFEYHLNRHIDVTVQHLGNTYWFPPELATVRKVLPSPKEEMSLCDIARMQNTNPVFIPGLSVDSSFRTLTVFNCRNFSPVMILAGLGRATFKDISVQDCSPWDEASWFYFGKMLTQNVSVRGAQLDVIRLAHFSQLENQRILISAENLGILCGPNPVGQTSVVTPGKARVEISVSNNTAATSPKILPAPAFGYGMDNLAGMFDEHYGHHTLLWFGIAEALGNAGLGLELSDRSRRMSMSVEFSRSKVRKECTFNCVFFSCSQSLLGQEERHREAAGSSSRGKVEGSFHQGVQCDP